MEGYGQNKKKLTASIEDKKCFAYSVDIYGEEVRGTPVTIEMAYKEGWYTKDGSKWPTMEDLMLEYRAAAFFGRKYIPDLLNGMHSDEEVIDIQHAEVVELGSKIGIENLNDKIIGKKDEPATSADQAPPAVGNKNDKASKIGL